MSDSEGEDDYQEQPEDEIFDAPAFRLPHHFDSERFEMWTVRLPQGMNPKNLDGLQISIDHSDSSSTEKTKKSKRNEPQRPPPQTIDFEDKEGNSLTLRWGDAREAQAFRMLLPKRALHRKDDDFEDDNENDTMLYPWDVAFERHATIGETMKNTGEMDLAPSIRTAPAPSGVVVRHSYSTVPQKTGLKRRWIPLGGGTTTAQSLPLKRKMSIIKEEQEKESLLSSSRNKSYAGNDDNDTPHRPSMGTTRVPASPPQKRIKTESSTPISSNRRPIEANTQTSSASPPDVTPPEDDSSSDTDHRKHKRASSAERKKAKKEKKEEKKAAKKAAKKAKKAQKKEKVKKEGSQMSE